MSWTRPKACAIASLLAIAAGCTGGSFGLGTTHSDTDQIPANDAGPLPVDSDSGNQRDAAQGGWDASIVDALDDRGVDAVGVGDAEGGLDAASADAGLPPAASLWVGPALPAFDEATVAHVRAVRTQGGAMGNQLSIFAKVGDSITASPSFLVDIGMAKTIYGAYGALAPAVSQFTVTLADGSNPFTRSSTSALGGWRAADPLGPPDEVAAEIGAIHPAYAIVMLGTNNVGAGTTQYRADMERLIDDVERLGTVAVVSTIPDRRDYPGAPADVVAVNQEIRGMAAARHLPLIDLYAALSPLVQAGLSGDHVHPSTNSTNAADFTSAGLAYGYDVRNLTALQMLDRLRSL